MLDDSISILGMHVHLMELHILSGKGQGHPSRSKVKNTSQKKSPLGPQVHAADIPQDSRTYMDKKAKIS